jgi:hypothetical protein
VYIQFPIADKYSRHSSPSCSGILLPAVFKGTEDGSDDNVANCHANCTNDEHWLSANLIDPENGRDGPSRVSRQLSSGGWGTHARNITTPTTPVARRDLDEIS